MTGWMRRGTAPLVVPLLAIVLAVSGCVRLPDAGPVVESALQDQDPETTDAFYLPNPPQPGETPTEIVLGFLEAMRANPVQTNVARQFLSERGRSSWDPERETITYGDLSTATGTETVRLNLLDAQRLDERGVWRGPLSQAETTQSFEMVSEEGEWRIAEAPDALIVPERWFETQFRRVSLYFFDPTGRILIPEPVYVPRGQQLATTLTRGLLRGPGEELEGVSRTFFPGEAGLELSVPVSANGTAAVALDAGEAVPSPEEISLMLAQLTWTLRQEPSIRSIRLSINGEPVIPASGATEFRIGSGREYDPTFADSSDALYGLRQGRLVEATPGAEPETSGALGEPGADLRSVAVNLTARLAAGVGSDGRTVRVAPLDADDGGVRASVRGRDFVKPSWDMSDRTWLVDRRRQGAVVSYVVGGRQFEIEVEGISGEEVTAAVISRDGSRLVAVLERPAGSAVVVARIRHDEAGEVLGATRASTIAWDSEDPLRITDLGWRTPSSVTVLNRLSDALVEVRTVAVDGSPGQDDTIADVNQVLRQPVADYVGSPVTEEGPFLVTETGMIDLTGSDRRAVPVAEGVSAVTFVG